ncbi:MAG: hypothetical protein AAF772_20935 [Acidobacteriota bacterium]
MADVNEMVDRAATEALDAVLPDDLDWRELVGRYPTIALVLAAAGGVVVGRAHGARILRAGVAMATAQVGSQLARILADVADAAAPGATGTDAPDASTEPAADETT